MFNEAALDVLAAARTSTYDDVVTFEVNAGGRRSGEAWEEHADLVGLPASVKQVGAAEEPAAGQHLGRRVFRVRFDADPAAGVTADAVRAGMRVRVHAREGYAERVLALIEPGDHGQRLGRWVRVLAVDGGGG